MVGNAKKIVLQSMQKVANCVFEDNVMIGLNVSLFASATNYMSQVLYDTTKVCADADENMTVTVKMKGLNISINAKVIFFILLYIILGVMQI